MADESPRGVFLNDKQLVFVFMTATVVLVVVFLCGILVGRGVQTFRGMAPDGTIISTGQVVPDPEPPPGLPERTPASPVPPGDGETLTYAQALKQPASPEVPLASPAGGAPPEASGPAENRSAAAPSEAARQIVVQVTAVRSRREAEIVVDHLKEKGYAAFVFAPDGTDGLAYFRVRVGPFGSVAEAEVAARRLEREEKYKPWIIR